MKRVIVGAALLTLVTAAGCAAKAYDPFRVTPDEFRRRVKTVAVARLTIPPFVGDSATAAAKFQPAIEAKLREAGFTVVPSEQVREVWDAKMSELGGLFDQQTGELNEAKATSLFEHVRGQMKTRFDAHALALPYVRRVTARFNNILFGGIDAKWDGASESITTGSLDKVLPPQYSGNVSALSLIVQIEDLDGSLLYRNAGGIQVLAKLASASERFGGETFVPVPKSELLVDQQRIQQAVNYALAPFFPRER